MTASARRSVSERHAARDLRLAIPALLLWLSAGLGIADPPRAGVVALLALLSAAVLITAALLVVSLRSHPAMATLALGAVAVAIGLGLAAAHGAHRSPASLPELVSGDRTITVVASIDEACTPVSRALSTRMRCTATATMIRSGDARLSAEVPVVVYTDENPQAGSAIRVTGTALTQPPESPAVLWIFAETARVVAAPRGIVAWAGELRTGLTTTAGSLPGWGGELLPGLAVGDTSSVGVELSTAMLEASLTHLTAVSGANCAVIIGLVLLLARALAWPRAVRTAAAGAALAVFVVVVTPQPSVLRAAVMATVVLASSLTGRASAGLSALSAAVTVILIADPWLSRDYGFVLSVAATTGLLVLTGPISRRLGRWMPEWLAIAIAIPVAAQVACQPILLMLSPGIPLGSVAANLLAAPAAPVATVLGLVVCALGGVPGLAGPVAWLAWVPSAWIGAVAHLFGTVMPLRFPWPGGPPGAAASGVMVAVVSAVLLLKPGPLRRAMAAVLALGLTVAVCAVGATEVAEALRRPADWSVAMCDVGQGDAAVVRDEGMVAVVDTGPAERPLGECLDELGIGRVDLLVLTHYDRDHAGGARALIGRVDVVLHGPTDGDEDEDLLTSFADGGATLARADESVRGRIGALRWRVLWPLSTVPVEAGNAASVVLAVDGKLSAVFLGDLGEEQLRHVRRGLEIGSVDVVKVSHHGSADQDPELYARLRATVGLIGVGADNGYGHPSDEALTMLSAAGTTAFRTDRAGMILVRAAADGVEVWTERATVP